MWFVLNVNNRVNWPCPQPLFVRCWLGVGRGWRVPALVLARVGFSFGFFSVLLWCWLGVSWYLPWRWLVLALHLAFFLISFWLFLFSFDFLFGFL